MRVELVTPCEHGSDRDCSVVKWCRDKATHVGQDYDHSYCQTSWSCPGGSRSTVSGFSPEAVQAAAAEAKHLLRTRPVRGFSASFSTTDFAEEIVDAALAAAWATDFGGDDA